MQTKLAEQTVNIPPVITAKFGKDEEWEKSLAWFVISPRRTTLYLAMFIIRELL